MTNHDTIYVDYLALKKELQNARHVHKIKHAIVESPFTDRLVPVHFGLGIIVLLICDHKNNTLNRIAISNTDLAKGAMSVSVVPFHQIKIPLDYDENILVKAINTNTIQMTEDWSNMFNPVLEPDEARMNQASAAIGTSAAHPLVSADGDKLGVMIFSYYEPLANIGNEHVEFMKLYAELVVERLTPEPLRNFL